MVTQRGFPSKHSWGWGIVTCLEQHGKALWWVHSAYALLLGIGLMWLGSRNFIFLRLAVFYIFFIWVSSLILPSILQHPRLPSRGRARFRLMVNYFQRNFYQQVLFFVLPIYFASATIRSGNILFVVILAVSAVLSTLDVVYDEYLSRKWANFAIFLAFNLFALINVLLPVSWGISNTSSLRISAGLAFLSFGTIYLRWRCMAHRSTWQVIGGSGIVLLLIIELGRPYIPPVPLRLAKAEFGTSIDAQALAVGGPIVTLPGSWNTKVYALTPIRAPLGLKERVRHEWSLDGELVFTSPFYTISGGRQQGYRLWTSYLAKDLFRGRRLSLDVKTEGGQLIGRAVLRVD
jgi:Family of unknown function (DUF5924)